MINFKTVISALTLVTVSLTVQAQAPLPAATSSASVVRDASGVPHIHADNDYDLFFMQGRIHATDRLFQMDLLRRSADGTLAEVLGTAALQTDVEARTFGLGRAAQRSLDAHPAPMQNILQAYSDGVNSLLDEAEAAGQLPPEYSGLGLASVRRWHPLDSVLVGKALAAGTSLSVTEDIDLSIALGTYQAVGEAAGFDGTTLFFEDLYRSAPFDPASTITDARAGSKLPANKHRGWHRSFHGVNDKVFGQGKSYTRRIRELPRFPGAMPLEGGDMGGSNSWVIGPQHSRTGQPILANDMHLRLESPTIFHEVQLTAPGIDVAGSSLPGAPCVVRGHNQSIAWGITNARLDVTDIYAEVIVPAAVPSGLATIENGVEEPIELLLETFRANVGGNVVAVLANQPVLVVPRRNNGPLITAPEPTASGPLPGALTALSVQSVGFGPTRDPEGICAINRATNLDEFKAAIQLIDFASQNLTYADSDGNIGYFISGELPLREDLQNPGGDITPPFLIRSGFGGNGWIPQAQPLPENQATPFAILPFDEMPQVVNPPTGFIVNANNDQAGNSLDNNPLNDLREGGNGLYYLNWGGRNFSIRAGRIAEMIEHRLSRRAKKISPAHMKQMQADIVLNDARALTPYIIGAYRNARRAGQANDRLAALADDPRVREAVKRLRKWRFTTPTGIAEGFDAAPQKGDAAESVAATIYSTWRGQMVANSIDATLDRLGLTDVPRPGRREELVTALKHLLERDGLGVSGLDFFAVPGVDEAATRRDILVLTSLADALDLLASDAFAPAFANSTEQDDYRWGRLHRIVLAHPLGTVEPNFNAPPAFGFVAAPLAGLDGIPTDGGFETVDEAPPATDNVRVTDSDSFMFDFGPTGRFVAAFGHGGIVAESSLPGGESALPGSPYYFNLLEPWLRNETFPLE